MTLPDQPTNQPRQVTPNWKRKAARRRDPRRRGTGGSHDWAIVRRIVSERARGKCEAGVRGICQVQGAHAHHVILRSQGGRDEADNLLWVCWQCHNWIHRNVALAVERGWIRQGLAE